jgi:hypothetical protein
LADYGSFEYGGIRFVKMVPQEEITRYIDSLSDDRKGDVREIVMSLEAAGLLSIEAMEDRTQEVAGPVSSGPVVAETPTPTGIYNPPQGTAYVQTPDGVKSIPEDRASQGMSYYIGQPPAPPKPGSITAALKIDPNLIRRSWT